MRKVADAERIQSFMRALGSAADDPVRVYFAGGATAVLMGWRASTIDIDLCFLPENDAVYRAIPRLKEELHINVELASPADFIPAIPGWEARSPFIAQERNASFYHYDPYGQALSKIERRHAQDIEDVRQFICSGLVDPARAMQYFEEMKSRLYLYPAIDPASFRKAVEQLLGDR